MMYNQCQVSLGHCFPGAAQNGVGALGCSVRSFNESPNRRVIAGNRSRHEGHRKHHAVRDSVRGLVNDP